MILETASEAEELVAQPLPEENVLARGRAAGASLLASVLRLFPVVADTVLARGRYGVIAGRLEWYMSSWLFTLLSLMQLSMGMSVVDASCVVVFVVDGDVVMVDKLTSEIGEMFAAAAIVVEDVVDDDEDDDEEEDGGADARSGVCA